MNAIRLIVVPYELGRLRDGVGCGPEHLLDRGAAKSLRKAGAELHQDLVTLDRPFSNEIDASFELVGQVSRRVGEAVGSGEFPVILSGSCCHAALGAVTGSGEDSPGVVWFDSHADFNSPDTADSGYLDGMGLAVLTGGAWQGMLAEVEGAQPVPETAVVLAGARDFDVPEERRLTSSRLNHLKPADVTAPAALSSAIEGLSPSPSGLYLHVDLDVLDADEVPVNIYSPPDGLSPDELESSVSTVLDSARVSAFSLTAYDPACDPDDAVPPIGLRLLELVANFVASDR